MPAGVDHAIWARAKAQARKQDKGTNWRYVMSIYKNMEQGAAREHVKRAALLQLLINITRHPS